MISEGPVMQNFKSAGYDIIILHRPFTEMSSSSLFDLELCNRNKYIDSQLLSLTIRTSILGFSLEKWQEHEIEVEAWEGHLPTYTKEEYVKIAVKLANDRIFRNSIINKTKKNKNKLFNDEKPIIFLENFIKNIKQIDN